MKVFIAFLVLLSLTGCALLKDAPKKFWGSSIAALEKARKDGVRETFNLDYEMSFAKAVDVLNKMGAYIYIQDKKKHVLVAIHLQGSTDSTELGIFFTGKSPQTTEIEISCLSTSLLDYASEKIFTRMKSK